MFKIYVSAVEYI